jgi:hypothetical protein
VDWTNRIGDLIPDADHRVAVISDKYMKRKVSVMKSLDRTFLKNHIMLSEYEIGESLKIPLQSAISLEIPTFPLRTIFGKSDQHHMINPNFLQIRLAIVQSLKGVAFQMNPLNNHLNGRN